MSLNKRVVEYFTVTKVNIYKMIEENVKHVFIQILNNAEINNFKTHLNLPLKILLLIHKELRIYIREGVIFNCMKTVKSLMMKYCKTTVNYSNYHLSSHSKQFVELSKVFTHLPMVMNVLAKQCRSQDSQVTA